MSCKEGRGSLELNPYAAVLYCSNNCLAALVSFAILEHNFLAIFCPSVETTAYQIIIIIIIKMYTYLHILPSCVGDSAS